MDSSESSRMSWTFYLEKADYLKNYKTNHTLLKIYSPPNKEINVSGAAVPSSPVLTDHKQM